MGLQLLLGLMLLGLVVHLLHPFSMYSATLAYRPPITQVILYKMVYLSHSTDVYASRVEAFMHGMIERAIATAFALARDKIRYHKLERDNLSFRVASCE